VLGYDISPLRGWFPVAAYRLRIPNSAITHALKSRSLPLRTA